MAYLLVWSVNGEFSILSTDVQKFETEGEMHDKAIGLLESDCRVKIDFAGFIAQEFEYLPVEKVTKYKFNRI